MKIDFKNNIICLNVTDRKGITLIDKKGISLIEILYVDKDYNILHASRKKISVNRYYRTRKIEDKNIIPDEILTKLDKVIIKIILFGRIAVFAELSKKIISDKYPCVDMIIINSLSIFKVLSLNTVNIPSLIESFDPQLKHLIAYKSAKDSIIEDNIRKHITSCNIEDETVKNKIFDFFNECEEDIMDFEYYIYN